MSDNEALILGEIQDNYVPFLKKLIAYLEKNKKITAGNLNRLKTMYTVFTTSSISEQIQVFNANKKRLEKWYKSQKKDEMTDNSEGTSTQRSKRTFEEDTDSSRRATDADPTKRSRSGSSSSADKASSDPAVVNQITEKKAAAIPVTPAAANPVSPDANKNGDILYSCASCQFQSIDEQDFMKHVKTEHRSDASMWCKHCDKCFSNALVLVSHIKEKACLRDGMIYRCGVRECTYETTSGQTFVYHLRNTHRGNPFIYCVHCQKFYTVPQCLVLHMQDECLYKERNRRNPDAVPTALKP